MNSNFELWSNNGSYSDPLYWFSSNYISSQQGILTCEYDTLGSTGNKFVKLTTKNIPGIGLLAGTLCSGFDSATSEFTRVPFGDRPKNLVGDFQYENLNQDMGYINIVLTKWNPVLNFTDFVAANTFVLNSSFPLWTHLELPLSYYSLEYPDSMSLFFSSSSFNSAYISEGHYLNIDNISFQGFVPGNPATDQMSTVQVYPNPSHDFLYIVENNIAPETIYEITTDKGKILQSEKLLEIKTRVDLTNFANGVYFLIIRNSVKKEVKKIIVF